MNETATSPGLEECERERDDAFETLNKDQAEYDKQLLALSSAFLGVSLAFIKDVVPLKDAVHLWEFDVALGCLLGCVCLVLLTFQYSIHSHLQLARYWEKKGKSLQAADDEKTKINNELEELRLRLSRKGIWIKRLNWVSGVLFGLGVIFLVAFVLVNMHRAAHHP